MRADNEIRQALCRELKEARYEASLAARRYKVVDPTKRPVGRELETRRNTALERVAHFEDRIARHDVAAALRPKVDRAALMALARDLTATWSAPGTDARTKRRITHILVREVVLDRDDATTRRSSRSIGTAGVTPNCASRACGPDATPPIGVSQAKCIIQVTVGQELS